jgi:hypothetical protein
MIQENKFSGKSTHEIKKTNLEYYFALGLEIENT